MDTYKEFCIRFWEATRELDLYSMDGSQLDRLIVDALLKTNEGKELIKTSTNELSVLIKAINHNNKKIQQPFLPDNLDEVVEKYANTHYEEFFEVEYDFGEPIEIIVDDKSFVRDAFKAGAKWMAEQGVTVIKKIGKIDDGVNQIPTYCNGFEITEIDVPFLNSKECGYGDEVIVQIRKK